MAPRRRVMGCPKLGPNSRVGLMPSDSRVRPASLIVVARVSQLAADSQIALGRSAAEQLL
jgi:hypothetical protein